MSIIAKKEEGAKIEALEAGVYMGTCVGIIDLGIQYSKMYDKETQKIMIIWELIGETVTIGDEVKPRTISKEYTLSLGEKANLTKGLEAWRGRKFTAEELEGFDLANIVNKSCQLNIIKEEKDNKKFNNINSIMPLAKGQKAVPVDQTMIFDFTEPASWEHWNKIPGWMQEKIKGAKNYEEAGLKAYVEDRAEENAVEEATGDTSDFITVDETEELPF